MSVNGAARVAPTLDSILSEFNRRFQRLESDLRQRRGFQSTETKPIGTSSGASTAGITGFLRSAGDQMTGPLALSPAITTIESGEVNISQELAVAYTSFVLLNPEGGIDDTLNTILGTSFPGQIIVFHVTNASITFSNTDNIAGNNTVVTADDNIAFIFDSIGVGKWRIWSGGASGGENVPDGTINFDHLEWDQNTLQWKALQTLAFGATSGTTGKLNFPNNTLAFSWRNLVDTGEIEVAVINDVFTITRNDKFAMSTSIQSQHLIEPTQSFNVTVGSGTVANTTTTLDTTTAILKVAVGGANRLTLNTLTSTALTLKSPDGITAQSFFDVVSTHVSESDQSIGIFVGSGDAADAVLTTTAAILKVAVGGVSRWQIDVNVGNIITQTAFGTNPLYDLFNDDSTPNDFDLIARIDYTGRNSAALKKTYGTALVDTLDVTNNQEEGCYIIQVMDNGNLLTKVAISSSEMNVNFIDIVDMGGETINGVVEESVVVPGNDFLLMYDASVLALRKVRIANLPGSGGAFLPLAGGTMSGIITMAGNDILSVDDITFNETNFSILKSGGQVYYQYDSSGKLIIGSHLTPVMTFEGNTIDIGVALTQIGFFGQAPTNQQTAPSDTLANLYTILRAYGLIT